MSYFDIGFAAASLVAAVVVVVFSRYHRAIIWECLFHPLTDGWIDYEEDESVFVYRGETLPDYVIGGALQALEETQRASEEAERHAANPVAQSAESSGWGHSATAAARGAGFISAYLFRRDRGAPRKES